MTKIIEVFDENSVDIEPNMCYNFIDYLREEGLSEKDLNYAMGIKSNKPLLSVQNPPQYEAVIDIALENSIFSDMYRGAIQNVTDIIARNEPILRSTYQTSARQTVEDSSVNTVIAFVGGRGTGKSSAMTSFRAFLQATLEERKNNAPNIGQVLGDKTFFALSTIDSSQISEKETVIGRMSASMLEEFEKNQKHLSVEKKQNFMRYAKDVNELAVMIRDGKWFQCGDKLLSDTHRICDMRNSVSKLVELYLSDIVEKDYLLLAIDDLDMGVQNAHSIMEEIRQYLSIPRVVVLVSIDENLLNAVMNITIAKSLGDSAKSDVHKPLVKDLAYRYLEKLFPVNRRHYTPTLNAQQLREWTADFHADQSDGMVVRDAILQLIWRKTMMLPVCNREGDHLLIPRNLRSLCNMAVLLRNMPDVSYKKSENSDLCTREDFAAANALEIREQLHHNLNVFGQYIVANIASYGAPRLNNESERDMAEVLENVIHQMMDVPLTRMNALVVGDILYHVNHVENPHDTYKLVLGDSAKQNSKSDLLSPAVLYPDAISLGDVMFVLGMLDSRSKCEYIRYLVEVIRTLWSIRMTEELFVTYIEGSDGKGTKTTETFRRVVSGLVVNPDHMDEYIENGGWKKYDDIVESSSTEIAKYMSAYQGSDAPTEKPWRKSRLGGRAYYHIDSYSKDKNIWCHPLAIYSHLLNEPLEGHDMVLPFYSFDFMYRYYEELHQSLRTETGRITFEILIKKLLEETNTDQITSNISRNSVLVVVFQGFIESLKETNNQLLTKYDSWQIMLPSLITALNEYSSCANTTTHSQLFKEIKKAVDSINTCSLSGAKWEALKRNLRIFEEKFKVKKPKSVEIAKNKDAAKELLEYLKNTHPEFNK